MNPYTLQEIKPVLSYIRDHKQERDVLYVYYGAQPAFEYYSRRYGLKDYILDPERYWLSYDLGKLRQNVRSLDRLRGHPRIWILFSHIHSNAQHDEEFYLYRLDEIGKRLDSFTSAGTAVYLYDLE